MSVTLLQGDCLEVMATLEAGSVDSIVCDPPYGLSFMGKHWDHGVPGVPFWEAALRVAKPGAMLLAFGGTRTFHRLTCAIEDAGWEIRDCLMWLYGSGFPKSHDIGKAIDKAAGAEREVIGKRNTHYPDSDCWGMPNQHVQSSNGYAGGFQPNAVDGARPITAPATDAARQWDGWGTALKPAWEPIIMARKPLIGTVADNVLAWGTGGINVDACRIGTSKDIPASPSRHVDTRCHGKFGAEDGSASGFNANIGRWPANLCLSEEAAALLDEMSGMLQSNSGNLTFSNRKQGVAYGKYNPAPTSGITDSGGASRFFYCAKASRSDRGEDNAHPTVKPTSLMRWLVRLVTPPGGVVLDQFCGSGSTGKAAVLEGFSFIGIDKEAEYLEIAKRRIEHAELQADPQLPLLEIAQ